MLEITTALSGTQSVLQLLQTAIQARDDARLRAALADLDVKLHALTVASLASAEKAAALEASLRAAERVQRELEVQLADRATYQLQEIRPGAFAYAPKPEHEGPQLPQHYVCQPCYDKGVKAVLRYEPGGEWATGKWTCPHALSHNIEDVQSGPPAPLHSQGQTEPCPHDCGHKKV